MILDNIVLVKLQAGLRSGHQATLDGLLARCRCRLEGVARGMFRRLPRLDSGGQVGSLVQEAARGLLGALGGRDVDDVRAFLCLAAELMRAQLLSLARNFRLASGYGAVADGAARWVALLEAAGQIPQEAREAFALRFFHGLSPAEVAAVTGTDEATARRRWLEAAAWLAAELDELPAGC